MEVVNFHICRDAFGSSNRSVGVKDGVNQSGRGDSAFQRGGLTELDFLAGVRFEALDEPVQGGTFVKGGDASEKATEFMGVQGDRSLALFERLEGFSSRSDGIGGSMEGEEISLKVCPRGIDR